MFHVERLEARIVQLFPFIWMSLSTTTTFPLDLSITSTMKYSNDYTLLLKLLLIVLLASTAEAIRHLRIVSPLQALTIWDKELPANDTWRNRFLGKVKAGLAAETSARKAMEGQATSSPVQSASSASKTNPKWALQAQRRERAKLAAQEQAAEAAFDQAVAQVDRQQTQQLAQAQKLHAKNNPNNYQFVGVVQPATKSDAAITWYARKKPASAKWSVRLVHVNQRAVMKDLFDRGHVDVFGKYTNTGQTDPETGAPLIAREYSLRQRSWRNLWNFSPKVR